MLFLIEMMRVLSIGSRFRSVDGLLPCADIAFKEISAHGIGPRLIASLEFGRVEEFLPGRTLNVLQLRNPVVFSSGISSFSAFVLRFFFHCLHFLLMMWSFVTVARKMADFHSLTPPVPHHDPSLLRFLTRWSKLALSVSFDPETDPGKFERWKQLEASFLSLVSSEMVWLIHSLSSLLSSVVFCHNDIQEVL